jgi:hypothetical protein
VVPVYWPLTTNAVTTSATTASSLWLTVTNPSATATTTGGPWLVIDDPYATHTASTLIYTTATNTITFRNRPGFPAQSGWLDDDDPQPFRPPPPAAPYVRRAEESFARLRAEANRRDDLNALERIGGIATVPAPEDGDGAARRAAAHQRARDLLLSYLDPDQRAMFMRERSFYVIGGSTGQRYRIRADSYSINVDAVNDNGVIAHRLCAHLDANIPLCDHLLAQKALLEWDEGTFLERANRHPLRGSL